MGLVTVRRPRIFSDSSSALSVLGRRGPSSKLKHLQLRDFVCQDRQREGRIRFQKIDTKANPVDFLTKFADQVSHDLGMKGVGQTTDDTAATT